MEPLSLVLYVSYYWLALALISLFQFKRLNHLLFNFGSLGGLALILIFFLNTNLDPNRQILPLGLASLPFHVRLDTLSVFFLLLLGCGSFGIGLFSTGYFKNQSTTPLVPFHFHIFLASMAFVFIADDAYSFLMAWEIMALSSYFLVTTDHGHPEVRQAGFLYLLMAHIGAFGILLSFAVLQNGDGYTFDAMRQTTLTPFWQQMAFILALFGFGTKAGLLPLHAWLPEAHPAAPSPVSALMSGVMLKTAVYGFVRVLFDLLGTTMPWWGGTLIILGLVTALFGVIFAATQSDMKRLLAYSSIENIGIIFTGLGLTIIFTAYDKPAMALLALTASLYHCLNHTFFKSLLFLGTGNILHATGQRHLEKLGGLIRKLPWVSALMLIGALSMAGLPLFNGFVSEWLLLQAFLYFPDLPIPYISMLVPIAAAALVLTASLAGYVAVKYYGIIFLGQPRAALSETAHDANLFERLGLLWFAFGCIFLGIFPAFVCNHLNSLTAFLMKKPLSENITNSSYFLIPDTIERAAYNPLLCFISIIIIISLVIISSRYVYKRFYPLPFRRVSAWDCAYLLRTPRMQDTAEGFGQPIQHIFLPFFKIESSLPDVLDKEPQYRLKTEDRFWYLFYAPIRSLTQQCNSFISKIQQKRLSIYLLYSFLTLLILLSFSNG